MTTLSQTLADNLQHVLDDISQAELQPYLNERNVLNLYWGNSGIALFYYQLYKTLGREQDRERAEACLEIAVDASNTPHDRETAFCAGHSGLAWTIDYFSRSGDFDLDSEEYLEHFDQILYQRIENALQEPVYDPMYGTLGYASYFLPRTSKTSTPALHGILHFLDALKLETDDGYTWRSETNFLNKDGQIEFNMGLAHGIPAVLSLLSRLYARNINPELCKKLIAGGYRWLLKQSETFRERYPESGFYYPHHILYGGEMRHPKLSWCYGDLSLSLALANAAQRLSDKAMLDHCRELAVHAAALARRTFTQTNDCGLCHGAAGNAYMFHKLNTLFPDPSIAEASLNFFRLLLSQRQKDKGIAGFQSLQYDDDKHEYYMMDDPGLLTGVAGIGLVLNTVLRQGDPAWDHCLLLS